MHFSILLFTPNPEIKLLISSSFSTKTLNIISITNYVDVHVCTAYCNTIIILMLCSLTSSVFFIMYVLYNYGFIQGYPQSMRL